MIRLLVDWFRTAYQINAMLCSLDNASLAQPHGTSRLKNTKIIQVYGLIIHTNMDFCSPVYLLSFTFIVFCVLPPLSLHLRGPKLHLHFLHFLYVPFFLHLLDFCFFPLFPIWSIYHDGKHSGASKITHPTFVD